MLKYGTLEIEVTISRKGIVSKGSSPNHNFTELRSEIIFEAIVVEQVAELIASCVSNLDLARNKVLEAVAETTAPLRPATDLLTQISSEDEEDEVTATSTVKEVELPLQRKKASREQEVASIEPVS